MKHLLFLTMVTLAVALFLAGCGGGSDADGLEGGTGAVTGYIYHADGETPVPGALVELASRIRLPLSTHTNAQGYFELRDVPTGAQSLTVTAGALRFTRDLTVTAGSVLTVGTASDPILLGETAGSNIVHMAVVEGAFDSVEDLLTDLGIPQQTTYTANATGWVMYDYDHTTDLLESAAEMAKYQIIFLNCGGDESYTTDAATQQRLRSFVQNGGVLYASDLMYDYVEQSWPQRIDFAGDDTMTDSAENGETGTITAKVNIPGLGFTTMPITMDLSSWAMIDKAPETNLAAQNVTVLIEGPRPLPQYDLVRSATGHGKGTRTTAPYQVGESYPLMVQFGDGNGKVIYTSFHNEAQMTTEMKSVMNRIVLGGI